MKSLFIITINSVSTHQEAIMSYKNRFKSVFMQACVFVVAMSGPGFSGVANAGESNNECPVGLVNGLTLNDEFGPEASDLTRCLDRRHNVKVVMQINKPCRDSFVDGTAVKNNVANCSQGSNDPDFGRSYALGNINNMIKDYEITYGMKPGRDYEIAAVVHSGGGYLLLKDESYDGTGTLLYGRNKFQGEVENLMDRGVKFYFCQNTTRSFIKNGTLPAAGVQGGATAQLIEGVEYVTAGVTAISDFQSQGYRYVQP
jgi:intracellular sulfur oxidation DsrE/DsrF family protein